MTTVAVPTYKLNSGYEIPLFGVGTFLAPGNTINIMLKNAIACGYTHIDCAERYGNQKEIGATLKEIFAEGKVKRQDLFITSKVFVNNLLPECILQSAKTTLADLQLDYLDLLLIHWPLTFAPVPFPADSFNADGSPKVAKVGFHVVWKAMEDLVRVHKLVRSIGVSNFGVQLLNDVLSYAEIPPATNQVEVHPFFSAVQSHRILLQQPHFGNGLQSPCASRPDAGAAEEDRGLRKPRPPRRRQEAWPHRRTGRPSLGAAAQGPEPLGRQGGAPLRQCGAHPQGNLARAPAGEHRHLRLCARRRRHRPDRYPRRRWPLWQPCATVSHPCV